MAFPILRNQQILRLELYVIDAEKFYSLSTLLLRPVGFDTLSSKINNFTSEGQWELAATPSIAMILLSLILVMVLNNRVDSE